MAKLISFIIKFFGLIFVASGCLSLLFAMVSFVNSSEIADITIFFLVALLFLWIGSFLRGWSIWEKIFKNKSKKEKYFKLALVTLTAIIVAYVIPQRINLWFYISDGQLRDSLEIEKSCVQSGGRIITKVCGYDNYPVYRGGPGCVGEICEVPIGRRIKLCDCEEVGSSFNGKECYHDSSCDID